MRNRFSQTDTQSEGNLSEIFLNQITKNDETLDESETNVSEFQNCFKLDYEALRKYLLEKYQYMENHSGLEKSKAAKGRNVFNFKDNSGKNIKQSKSLNDVKTQVLNEKKIMMKVAEDGLNRFSILNLKSIGPYKLTKTIGSGSTSKVRLGIHEISRQKKAIKIIPRKGIELQKNSKESVESREARIYREAALLSLLSHPNIVGMSEMITSPDMFCLFFEYVEGQQLLEYVITHGALREKVAKKLFAQLLSAVSYCHQNSIVHRDLKIENIMIDKIGNVKLLDFGLSNFFDPNEQLKTFCGSLYFAAPELLSGKAYTGPEVDVWSLGVIIYVLLVGQVPFDDKNIHSLHEKIKAAKFQIPPHVSIEAKSLIKKMIVVDPKSRYSLREIINHPWLADNEIPNCIPERLPFDIVDKKVAEYLKNEFSAQFKNIDKILVTATKDWSKVKGSPVISLYFLVKEKLLKEKRNSNELLREPDLSLLPCPPPKSHYKSPQHEVSIPIPGPDNHRKGHSSSDKIQRQIKYYAPAVEIETPVNLKVKHILFRSFFSFYPTNCKSVNEIFSRIEATLKHKGIAYNVKEGVLHCQLHAVTEVREFLAFEILIAKTLIGGTLGIQFKKSIGESKLFKTITAQVASEIN